MRWLQTGIQGAMRRSCRPAWSNHHDGERNSTLVTCEIGQKGDGKVGEGGLGLSNNIHTLHEEDYGVLLDFLIEDPAFVGFYLLCTSCSSCSRDIASGITGAIGQ